MIQNLHCRGHWQPAHIRKKVAKWCDAKLMQMFICIEAHVMDYSLAEENKKKQSSIRLFYNEHLNKYSHDLK